MHETTGQDGRAALLRRLALKRRMAQAVLLIEAVLPLLIIPASILMMFIVAAWFGLFRVLPGFVSFAVLIAWLAGFLMALRPFGRIIWPDAAAADHLLESRNGLAHQPVAVQEDRPAIDTPFARALWRAHQARMAKRIAALDPGLPRPDISRFDAYGLRAVPVLLLAVAFGYSFSNQAGRMSDAFSSSAYRGPADPGLRVDAWVTPPAYTGRAPIYVTGRADAEGNAFEVPQNAQLVVRVAGASASETVVYTPDHGDALTLEASAVAAPGAPDSTGDKGQATARHYATTLKDSGTLAVNGQSFRFSIIPDTLPEIAFDGAPRASANGSLEIAFKARDDYGLVSARAEIEPAEEPLPGVSGLYDAPEFKLDLPRRGGTLVKGLTSRNLTEHPLSGTRVRITLVGVDASGQEGRSAAHEMTMPARRFYEPLAGAVAEQRQVFALNTAALPRSIALNEALTLRPDETIPNMTHFLLIRSALGRMQMAGSKEDLQNAADYLWDIALGIEDGDLSQAERDMRAAQKALSDALERGASDDEIKKLTAELRQAMNRYLSEMARQMQNRQPGQMGDQAQKTLRQQDLEKMLDQIENLARSGNQDAARQLLSEMQRMMNNLQAGRPAKPGDGRDRSPMRQQIDKLGELMQQQQKLMDQTFQLEQQLQNRALEDQQELGEENDLFERPEGQPPEQQQGEQKPGGEQQGNAPSEQQLRDALKGLREQQDALGKKLQELQKGLSDLGIKPGEKFGEAGKRMKGAGEALGEGDGTKAVDGQGKALEALRDGARDMMQQMMQAMQQQGEGQPSGQGMAGQGGKDGRDPLGRPQSSSGPEFGDQVKVPDEIDAQRARQILEAIRDKLSNGLGGDIERRYLERLLDLK